MRRQEFQAACRVLKISRGEVLDHPDAGLDRVNFYALVGELVERIRGIRPHVMMTIGPEGAVTAHPDHSMASLAATLAEGAPVMLAASLPAQSERRYCQSLQIHPPQRRAGSLTLLFHARPARLTQTCWTAASAVPRSCGALSPDVRGRRRLPRPPS